LTSEPFLPDIAGSASFDAPLFHCRYLLDHADTLFKTATSVAVSVVPNLHGTLLTLLHLLVSPSTGSLGSPAMDLFGWHCPMLRP
jgi:hypothetical protein